MGYNKEKAFAVARLRQAARDCKVRKTLLKLRHTASRTKVEDNPELDLKGFDRSAHDLALNGFQSGGVTCSVLPQILPLVSPSF